MVGAERWRDNWRMLAPGGAIRVEVRGARARGEDVSRIRRLPVGTPVVLAASGPGATRRCRAFAARAGIELDRAFLAIPTVRAPGCLVEDASASTAVFVRNVLVAPQRTRLGAIVDGGLALLRALGSRRLLALVVPGRIVVGVRA